MDSVGQVAALLEPTAVVSHAYLTRAGDTNWSPPGQRVAGISWTRVEATFRKVRFDLDYIRNWSLLWDIQIIFLTVFGSSSKRNAY